MNQLYLLSLKAFIENTSSKDGKNLYKFLQEGVSKEINRFKEPVLIPLSYMQRDVAIESIHASWYKLQLESYPKEEIAFYLSSLPVITRDSLLELLEIKPSILKLSTFAKSFFAEKFFLDFTQKNPFLPIEFLPKSPFNDLLLLKKNYLTTLIDLLGVQDLALDIRKVLDKRILDDISSKLQDHQKKYLLNILRIGDLPLVKSEELVFWQKSKEALSLIITQKGLYRLSIALLGQNENLIWHIARLLDITRGMQLIKNLQDKSTGAINTKIKEQISLNTLNLLNLFKEGN
jgi:hypothetical protein